MIRSMTGFASASGADAPFAWGWEVRSVNGKGLDLRLRVPDWVDGLEVGLRACLAPARERHVRRVVVVHRERQARGDGVEPAELGVRHEGVAGGL